MNIKLDHPALKIGAIATSGLLALGAFLDAVSNSISVVTPYMTYILTPLIASVAGLVHFVLKKYPFTITKDEGKVEQITGLNLKVVATLIGIIVLLWIPRFWGTNAPAANANNNLLVNENKGEISFDVWVHRFEEIWNDKEELIKEFNIYEKPSESPYVITYNAKNEDGFLKIEPHLGYLETINSEKGIGVAYRSFGAIPPTLDFKVANNTKETIFLTKVILQVEASRPDPFPFIKFNEVIGCLNFTKRGVFFVSNDGWGNFKRLEMKFRIQKYGEKPNFEEPFPYSRSFQNVNEATVDIREELKNDFGVDVNTLEKIAEKAKKSDYRYGKEKLPELTSEEKEQLNLAKKKFNRNPKYGFGVFDSDYELEITKPDTLIVGIISFTGDTWNGGEKEVVTRFTADVESMIEPTECGDYSPPTSSYDVRLQINKDNYEIIVPISHSLKQGETDRFLIKLAAGQSSVHKLRAKIVTSDGKEFASPPINLSLLMPKSILGGDFPTDITKDEITKQPRLRVVKNSDSAK